MSDLMEFDESVLERLNELGGPSLVLELLSLFRTHSPGKISEIHTGLEEGDLDKVERAAHYMKSSSGNLGLPAMHELCRQIEELAESGQTESLPELAKALGKMYNRIAEKLGQVREDLET